MVRVDFILRIILTHECSYMGFSEHQSKAYIGTRVCNYCTPYKKQGDLDDAREITAV